MKTIHVLVIILVMLYSCRSTSNTGEVNISIAASKGFVVSDEGTARKIAEAIWLPIYGKDVVLSQKPYNVTLQCDSLWIVEGVLNDKVLGGALLIEIRARNCEVIRVIHGK